MPHSPPPLRDILLVDLETSGTDPEAHGIVQIGAIVLDQVTYAEHGSLSVFVRLAEHDALDAESVRISKIDERVSRSAFATELSSALEQLESFSNPADCFLAAWNGAFDLSFLRAAYRRAGRAWPWDYHFLELWSLAWISLPEVVNPSLERVSQTLGITTPITHDALADCRQEAEVLRRLVARRQS